MRLTLLRLNPVWLILVIQTFTGQITSDYDFNNLSSTCGQGGTIAVIYTITDDCGNATTLKCNTYP